MSTKDQKKLITIGWCLVISFVLLSCVNRQTNQRSLVANQSRCEVEIIRNSLPQRDFVKLDRLDVHIEKTFFAGSDFSDAVEELKNKACEKKADAIIDIEERSSIYLETRIYHVTATAIKYTDLPGGASHEVKNMPSIPPGRRDALVIGNANYNPSVGKLANPVNDASDLASALKSLHFNVILTLNNKKTDLERMIKSFTESLATDSVALLYYAGHGVQIEGQNYLIPVDASADDEIEAKNVSISMDAVLERMQKTKNKMNIIIFDACRNNPFARRFRSTAGRGLAMVHGMPGALIAYSTEPNNVAFDGDGRNSPYTEALLQYIKQPGLEIKDLFIEVRNMVSSKTSGKQIPWESQSLFGKFYFVSN